MSRKRTLKKQQKRQESALAQLEELARRGADDEFIARAAEQVKDPAASPMSPITALWVEVTGRALRQSLAGADLDRIERLLRSLRRAGRLRPLAVLAEAVLDLAAGRLEAARSRLAVLAGMEGAGEEIPRELLASLQSLACDEPLRLETGRPPEDPYVQAAGAFLGALRELEARGFAPDAPDRENLARSLAALRAAAPAKDRELGGLLDSAGRCLSLLTDLAALEDRLAEGEPPASSRAAGWLRGQGPALLATLAASGPPLLAPLRQAVRLRWRAVLERVAQREGPAGLAALCTAEPRLLAHDVDLSSGGLAALRQTAEARQLLASRRHGALARLLRSRSRSGSDSGGDLAALWGLELWALKNRAQDEEDPGGEEDTSPHRTLVRLQEMAGEIGRRFPAEQRAAVARWLRGELFDLCEQTQFCEHTAEAALSLLEHQPGDIGLLIAGLAGAIARGGSRTRRALEARVPRDGRMPAEALATAERLMIQVALEAPLDIPGILDGLRPLFPAGSWPTMAALVAREMGPGLALVLHKASFEIYDDPALESLVLGEIRRTVDRLQPALAGTPGFAAMELLLDCWRSTPSAVETKLGGLLAGFPGLDGPVTAFRVLRRALSPVTPPGIEAALRGLAHAVIDHHLEDRWQLWGHEAPFLAVLADKPHRRHLGKKIRKLLASPEIPAEGREILGEALHAIDHIENLKRVLLPRKGRRPTRGEPVPIPEPSQPKRKKLRPSKDDISQPWLDL
jgi:hypothetical protein